MTHDKPVTSPARRTDVVREGRWREARGYARYLAALLVPGSPVPVYQRPDKRAGDLEGLSEEEHDLLIEEGRRQLERQSADLGRNHTRAATLLTISIAELVFLTRSAPTVFDHGLVVIAPWAASTLLAVLALGGAVSVLTTRAVFGHVDTATLADHEGPLRPELARRYADAVGIGEATNAARLTVLRDAVWLAVLAAVVLIFITPFSTPRQPSPASCTVPVGATCTPLKSATPSTPASSSPSPQSPGPSSPAATSSPPSRTTPHPQPTSP